MEEEDTVSTNLKEPVEETTRPLAPVPVDPVPLNPVPQSPAEAEMDSENEGHEVLTSSKPMMEKTTAKPMVSQKPTTTSITSTEKKPTTTTKATTPRPKPTVSETEKPQINAAGAAAGAFMSPEPESEPEANPDTSSVPQNTVQVLFAHVSAALGWSIKF